MQNKLDSKVKNDVMKLIKQWVKFNDWAVCILKFNSRVINNLTNSLFDNVSSKRSKATRMELQHFQQHRSLGTKAF